MVRNGHYRAVVAGALVLMAGLAAGPRDAERDFIAENFFPPELLMQTHEMLDLTEEQKTEGRADIEKTHEALAEVRQQIEKEREALVALVKETKLDEKKVLAQAEKVMDMENEAKRMQLGLLIRLKNRLTAPQQEKLREIRSKMAAIQPKIRRAHELAQQWRDQGRDLSSLEQDKNEFDALLRQGKFAEAEVLLDKALKTLSTKDGK